MLVVHASELASCIGMHRYRPVSEGIVVLFARMAPDTYQEALSRNKLREKAKIEDTLAKLANTTAVEVTEAVEATDTGRSTKLLDEILKSAPVANDPSLVADIRSFVYTERGKKAEDSSLNRAEGQLGQKIQQRNSRYIKKLIAYAPERKLQLGGKVDGITDDGRLVEMKNRQRQLFSYVPIYEKVQVHAYMYLTDLRECRLIQMFNDTESTTVVPFDEEFWSEILRRLSLVATRLDELVVNPDMQDELLTADRFRLDFDNWII